MVASLNRTALVYEPGQRIKYSNAGVATVGYILERTQGQPFAGYLKAHLLEPLGMLKSGFEPEPALVKDLAHALMWTYHGREFPAPTFELGMAPAGSMYSTATDLARFAAVLFAGGRGAKGPIVKPATIEQMWQPQFAKPNEKAGFGIGFRIGELDGRRRVGHGGAIYGFATELALLPDDKLAVVVIAARDVTNAVTSHIADVALSQLRAVQQGKPLPAIDKATPLAAGEARRLAGKYRCGDKVIDLSERDARLWLLPERGGFRVEVRALGKAPVVDDRLDYGTRIKRDGDGLRIGKDVYQRLPPAKPAPAPSRWQGLIGEYGWDHNTLYIHEKDNKLCALIEWFFVYPLEEVNADTYKFPDFGLYHDEQLIFRRDASGRATQVNAAQVMFPRRHIEGENGATFRIQPIRPLDELRREALRSQPPREAGAFLKPDLVDLGTLDADLKFDIRYATTNNFLSEPFYTSARAYLQRPAAEALLRVHRKLSGQGYGLLIHDAYRPWYVTKMFWEATPQKQRIFVADPSKGSRHNRGCAVDLTLYDRKTGKPVAMVGGYDEMSDRSYPDYMGGTSLQRWHRDLLRRSMEDEGFSVYEAEWWHFDYKDWQQYPVLNQSFEELAQARQE
jgi:serine beta-lactamase-like protein LACTB